MSKLGTNFAVFVLFFGVSLLTAVETRDWLMTAFWAAIGLVFLWIDMKGSKSEERP